MESKIEQYLHEKALATDMNVGHKAGKPMSEWTLGEMKSFCAERSDGHGVEINVCQNCPLNVVCAMTPEDWDLSNQADFADQAAEPDPVNHPAHYTQGGVECIDALKAATTGLEGIQAVCTANAIKYLWRWKQKNGVQDLDKAEWYLRRLKEEIAL